MAAEDFSRNSQSDGMDVSNVERRVIQEGEPDFYETNCHWRGCDYEFETQAELVKVWWSSSYQH